MIKIEEIKKEHIEDIYGLIGCEKHEFPELPVSCPTREATEKKIKEIGESGFSRVLVYTPAENAASIVVGYFLAQIDKVLGTAMIEQWYVHPKFRHNRKSYALLKEFELWAVENDAKYCILGGGYGLDKRKAARLGYDKELILFMKEM